MNDLSMNAESPSTNGKNGRDANGRFTKSNPGGPGNPLAGRVAKFRAALLSAVSENDLKAIAKKLVAKAKTGNIPAIKELLDRTVGRMPIMDDDDQDEPGRVIPTIEILINGRDEYEQFRRLTDIGAVSHTSVSVK